MISFAVRKIASLPAAAAAAAAAHGGRGRGGQADQEVGAPPRPASAVRPC